MKFVLLPTADRCLQEIFAWLNENEPAIEPRVRHEVFQTIELLTSFPELGRQCNFADYRVINAGEYAIYYRNTITTVVVYAVIHQSRDQIAFFGLDQ